MKKTKKTDDVVVTMLDPKKLRGHELNREFATSGFEWAEFVGSVKEAGRILTPLLVRPMDGGTWWEILAGHRRAAAAVVCGIKLVPCVVRELDEEEALCVLVNENLQRLDLSPVDEARLVASMKSVLELEEDEIARRISRSVGWVRTRQMMLALGDEVLEAVRDRHPDRHCCLATVEEILKVPEDLREEAVQLVLHPDFQIQPMAPDVARDVLRKVLVEPRLAQIAWDKGSAALAKEWRKRLEAQRTAVTGTGDIGVSVVSWKEWDGGAMLRSELWMDADDEIPAELTDDEAPSGARWLDLAERHGLSVRIVPGVVEDETRAVVAGRLLQLAEDARRAAGMEAWLMPGKGSAKDRRVAAAVANLNGEGDPEFDDDDVQRTITQGMEHHAWVDLGVVRKVMEWAGEQGTGDRGQETEDAVPEFVPGWARFLGERGMWNEVGLVCDWVMGLKVNQEG